MLDLSRDVDSLSRFKRNTTKCLEQIERTGEPLVLTLNGKPKAVVLTPRAYTKLAELADRMETLEALRVGLSQADAGQGVPLEEAFVALRRKHELLG